MREKIYKFLDTYVGEGARCEYIRFSHKTFSDHYSVVSDNETEILWFSVKHDKVVVFRSEALCDTIISFFGTPKEDTWKYIRDWFGVKHNIKVLSDLLKLILKNETDVVI